MAVNELATQIVLSHLKSAAAASEAGTRLALAKEFALSAQQYYLAADLYVLAHQPEVAAIQRRSAELVSART